MHFFKNVDGAYIGSISTGCGQTEISEQEYNAIHDTIHNAPAALDGFVYKLRADKLEWEPVELSPAPEPSEEPAEIEDYEKALDDMGVQLNGD